MKRIVLIIATIFISLSLNAQQIQTYTDVNVKKKQQFLPSVDNFVNILDMDMEYFKLECLRLEFDTRMADNFCIEAFPQCNFNSGCGMIYKCVDRVSYLWTDPTGQKSNLQALFSDLSKQMNSTTDSDGFKVFIFKHKLTMKSYKLKVRSKVESGSISEILVIDKN